jgi:hypothetical protein
MQELLQKLERRFHDRAILDLWNRWWRCGLGDVFVGSLLRESAGRRIYSRRARLHRAIDEHSGVSTIARISILAKKALNLLRRPPTPSKGKTLPVYCTELPLTIIVVAALFWTTAATRVYARECRPVDVQSKYYPHERTLRPMARVMAEQGSLTHQISIIRAQQDHSRQQVEATGISVVKDCDREPFQAAMAGLPQPAALDPAAPVLIARMGQVE